MLDERKTVWVATLIERDGGGEVATIVAESAKQAFSSIADKIRDLFAEWGTFSPGHCGDMNSYELFEEWCHEAFHRTVVVEQHRLHEHTDWAERRIAVEALRSLIKGEA